MIKKVFVYISYFVLLVALTSCPQENPLLVNPPSQAETVHLRFLNMTSDFQPRTLKLENEVHVADVAFGKISTARNPIGDSALVAIYKADEEKFATAMRLRYSRNMAYTYIAFPTLPEEEGYPNKDTLISTVTSVTLPQVTNFAYIKTINAVNDIGGFSIRIGCPNGPSISESVQFRRVAPASEQLFGPLTVSLIQNKDGLSTPLGIYNIETLARGEYAFVIMKNKNNEIELYFLNERDYTTDAMVKLEPAEQYETYLRVVNLTYQPKTVNKRIDTLGNFESIVDNLQPNFASDYFTLEACQSAQQDRLSVVDNTGFETTYISTSLSVSNTFTQFIVSDREGDDRTVVMRPERIFASTAGKSVIRVLNGLDIDENITITLGARQIELNGKLELIRDQILTDNMMFTDISNPVVIEPGVAPISVFTSRQPLSFITCGNYELFPDRSYVVAINKNENGTPVIKVIEEELESNSVYISPLGTLAQFVNAVPGKDSLELTFSGPALTPRLDDAPLYYRRAFSTILPTGTIQLEADGAVYSLNAEPNKRILIIMAGDKREIDFLDLSGEPIEVSKTRFNRRFVNAAKDAPLITWRDVAATNVAPLVTGLPYGRVSGVNSMEFIRRFTYFVTDTQNDEFIYEQPARHSFGRNYNIIFLGNSAKEGYGIFEIIEY